MSPDLSDLIIQLTAITAPERKFAHGDPAKPPSDAPTGNPLS